MAYRVVYSWNVDWVGPGENVMSGNLAPPLPIGGRGGAQTLEFSNKQGGINSVTMVGADVTALAAALSADFTAQMTAALSRLQGFASGGG